MKKLLKRKQKGKQRKKQRKKAKMKMERRISQMTENCNQITYDRFLNFETQIVSYNFKSIIILDEYL